VVKHAEGLARRAARNSLFSGLEFVIGVVLTFAATPVIVRHLGSERYGILALATTFAGFMALLDVGMGSAVGRSLSYHHAREETRESEAVVGASIVFYTIVGVIGLGLTLVFAGPLLPHLFDFTRTSLAEARAAFVISGVGFMLTMLAVPVRTVPLSLQRFDATAMVNIAVGIVTATASVVLVVMGLGLVAVVIVNAVGAALALCTYFFLARRLAPSMRIRPVWDLRLLRSIFSFGLLVFVAQISAVVLFQLDRIVLGAVAGVSLVTYYVVPGLLAQRLQAVATKLTLVVFPAATDLVARGEHTRLVTLYKRATGMLVIGLLSAATPLLVAGPRLLHFWLGADFAGRSGGILRILVLTYFVIGLTTVAYYSALAFGRPGVPAFIYGVCAVTNIALMIVLIPPFKLMGAAIAYGASALPLLGLLWFAEVHLLNLSPRHWLSLAKRTTPMIALEATASGLAGHFAANLAEVVLCIVGVAAGGLVLYFAVLADDGDRETLDLFLPPKARRLLRLRHRPRQTNAA
jgi:O-antigen/teichoic acid export membrane protein